MVLRYPHTSRVVAIGDVHGDYGALFGALKLAGAVSDDCRWIGGDLRVVQLGDLLDRGYDEVKIFETVERLTDEAHANGGGLHLLLGNHELMAVDGHDDYYWKSKHGWEPERFVHFRPGTGEKALVLADKFSPAVIIGENLFVHAGISETVLKNLDRVVTKTKRWLAGGAEDMSLGSDLDVLVWDRSWHEDLLVRGKQNAAVATLRSMLKAHGLKRVVCGHTPRVKVELESTFEGQIWNCDLPLNNFMQQHYLEDLHLPETSSSIKVQVLELTPGQEPKVLTAYR